MKTLKSERITYVDHAAEIIAKAAGLTAEGERFALITSIKIEGGAARDVGSLALVDARGEMTGYLSNGCIDRDIRLRALEALGNNKKQVVRYGDGSRFMDLQLPCGGSLTIVIDPIPNAQAIAQAQQCLSNRQSARLSFSSEIDPSRSTEAAHFEYSPKFRVLLAGRGAIFRSVARAAEAVGLELDLKSPDTDDLEALSTLNPVSIQHLRTPNDVMSVGCVDQFTAVLTLFHDHDWEPTILRAALETRAFFIGSLGSKRTHTQRCETLVAEGVNPKLLHRLKGPIGLVPSLRSAPLIAVSALAEITQEMPRQIVQL